MRKILLLPLLLNLSCAAWWADTRPGVVDCGKAEVRTVVLQLLPDIALLLATAGTDWPQLVQEKLKDAGEYEQCVVQAAINGLEDIAPGGAASSPPVPAQYPPQGPSHFQQPPQRPDASLALFCALAEGSGQAVPPDCASLSPKARALGRAKSLLK